MTGRLGSHWGAGLPVGGCLDFIPLEVSERLVLNDSGGVQERVTVLAAPFPILKSGIEQPITLTEGMNREAACYCDRH